MASTYLKRKLETYRSLYQMNLEFTAILRHLWRIKQAGFLKPEKLKVFQGLTLELQSQISHDLADRMHQVEDDDMFRFGKTRIAWENWLNPEKPALHTEPPPKEAVKPVVASGERNGNGHRPMAPPLDSPPPRTQIV